MTNLSTLLSYLWSLVSSNWPYGLAGVLFLIIVIFLIYPEKVVVWSSILSRLFSMFSDRAEKAAVSRNIRARISAFRKRENTIMQEILPHNLKIRWVSSGENYAELKEGEIIVVLKEHTNQPQNFVTATLAYLQKGLLPTARTYCPTKLLRGMELVMANRIIIEERTDALDIFERDTLRPERASDVDLDSIILSLSDIENRRLFTTILLPEISMYGSSIFPSLPEESDRNLVEQIFHLTERIAHKVPGVHDAPYVIKNKKANLCVVLVASEETTMKFGIEAHFRYIKERVSDGICNFYLLAAGVNLPYAEKLTNRLSESGDFVIERKEAYTSRKRKNLQVFVSRLRYVRDRN